jgi:hypothetical protein
MAVAVEYLEHPPPGWFVVDVMRAGARKWDWVALLIDVPPDDFGSWKRAARWGWYRIPGRHRTSDAARAALEDLMATRH